MEALTLVNSLISEREEKLIVRTVKRQRIISSQDIKEFTKLMLRQRQLKEYYINMDMCVVLRGRNHSLLRRIERQD